jgi:hypothetical protein
MQPARIQPHAKEHTNNPVQRPNFRGHAAGDVEVTRDCGKVPSLPTVIIIIIYYLFSWNGGRAEAVCAGGKEVRMR